LRALAESLHQQYRGVRALVAVHRDFLVLGRIDEAARRAAQRLHQTVEQLHLNQIARLDRAALVLDQSEAVGFRHRAHQSSRVCMSPH
jgi:hypothetical protein